MEVNKAVISGPGTISLEICAEVKNSLKKKKGCRPDTHGSFDFWVDLKGWCQLTQLGVASDLLESTPFSPSQTNAWVTSIQTN